mgnify:CR=1 FL=1
MGRTHKYFDTRKNEHLGMDKNSAIYKHLQNSKQCRDKNDQKSFSVLDYAKIDYELALKEAMHIRWVQPCMNGQKQHEIVKLLI